MDQRSSDAPRLVVVTGDKPGRTIELKDGKIVLGRTKGDVVIDDSRMSRAHVEIHFDAANGKVRFVDLKSMNGTLRNGAVEAEGELRHGDTIQVGDTTLRCDLAAISGDASLVAMVNDASQSKAFREPKLGGDANFEVIPAGGKSRGGASYGSQGVEPRVTFEAGSIPEHQFINNSDPHHEEERRPEPLLPIGGGDVAPTQTYENRPPRRSLVLGLFRLLGSAFRILPKRVRVYAIAAVALVAALSIVKMPGGKGESAGDFFAKARSLEQMARGGNGQDALAQAEALRTAHPERAEAWYVLGSIQLVTNKPELALLSLEKARQLNPALPVVRAKLLRVYARAKRLPEAEQELQAVEQLLQKGMASREFLEETASALLENRDLKQPVEKVLILAKALQTEYAPDSSVGYRLEAQAFLDAKRPQEALAAIDRGLKLDSSDEELLETAIYARLGTQDLSGALLVADGWTQRRPKSTKARLIAAHIQFNQGSPMAAVPHLQKILEIDGEQNEARDAYFAEALDLLGVIAQRANQAEDATRYFQRACETGFGQSCERLRGPAAQPGAAAPAAGAAAPAGDPAAPPAAEDPNGGM